MMKSISQPSALKNDTELHALEYRNFCFSYTDTADAPAHCSSKPRTLATVPHSSVASPSPIASESLATPLIGPLNLTLPQGAFAVLTGSTGVGKTTLLRCAKPEIAPQGTRSGETFVRGASTRDLSPCESAEQIGYVQDSPEGALVCTDVLHEIAFGLENLGTPQSQMRARVAEVAYFFDIENILHANVNDISGGQQQIVNLASVVVAQPHVLLLDEPTNQLDPIATKNFCHALFRLNREIGMTIMVATHTPEIYADYATCCFELAGGQVRATTCAGTSELADRQVEACANTTKLKRDRSRTDAQKPHRSQPAVSIKSVYFRFERQQPNVLRGATFNAMRERIHALVGANGCGKTTMLKMIAGVLKPQRGKCKNVCAQNQAYMPQNPKALFTCDTLHEELEGWEEGNFDEVSWVLRGECEKRAGRARDMQDGWARNAPPNIHPYDLSCGQQHMLALQKLLMAKPDLLLLDEPTCGLDADCTLYVAQTLSQFAHNGGTVIMATHDLAFCEAVADEVSMIFDGEVVCTSPASDFFASNLFYRPQPCEFSRRFAQVHAREQASEQLHVKKHADVYSNEQTCE